MVRRKALTFLIIASTAFSASAYYDRYGTWHPGVVESVKEAGTDVLDAVTGGRYSDTPEEHKARTKAERKLEDKQRTNRRKYQDEQEKIQRKKEDRKNRRI
jgi:hypothetical protein